MLFQTQTIDVGLSNRLGLLPVAASKAKSFALTFVRDVLSNSAFAVRGYSPFSDSRLMFNIAKLQAGLVLPKQRFCFGGPPERLSVNSLASPSITVSIESLGNLERNGLVIEKGVTLTLSVDFQGSISTLIDRRPMIDSISVSARTADGKVRAFHFSHPLFCSDLVEKAGIQVPFLKKLVAVNGFTIRR